MVEEQKSIKKSPPMLRSRVGIDVLKQLDIFAAQHLGEMTRVQIVEAAIRKYVGPQEPDHEIDEERMEITVKITDWDEDDRKVIELMRSEQKLDNWKAVVLALVDEAITNRREWEQKER